MHGGAGAKHPAPAMFVQALQLLQAVLEEAERIVEQKLKSLASDLPPETPVPLLATSGGAQYVYVRQLQMEQATTPLPT